MPFGFTSTLVQRSDRPSRDRQPLDRYILSVCPRGPNNWHLPCIVGNGTSTTV